MAPEEAILRCFAITALAPVFAFLAQIRPTYRPQKKTARFLDRAASRGDRGNVERNTGKRFYSASKVMLTLALTISFADWTTVPESSSTSAGSSIPVVREYTFPTLFW